MERNDLLAPPPVLLPADPAAGVPDLLSEDTVIAHPESPLAWAARAEAALEAAESSGESGADSRAQAPAGFAGLATPRLVAYAFARTGYHRSLDRLRANGWKGWGPVPFSHEPNQGVLRAIAALARAARLIGEDAEFERCAKMLEDADPQAPAELLGA